MTCSLRAPDPAELPVCVDDSEKGKPDQHEFLPFHPRSIVHWSLHFVQVAAEARPPRALTRWQRLDAFDWADSPMPCFGNSLAICDL
jgi:hypothetical protein